MSGQRLYERWQVSVAPSASALAIARERHQPQQPSDELVALASGRGLDLTGAEIAEIATLFGQDKATFAPTRARFQLYKDFAARARHLLIATRGEHAQDDRMGTYLEILPTAGVHDHRLTTLEIANIPLEAELVTLAACDTASGQALLSDERLDLTRAFLIAGANAVLATRWKVPEDFATTSFVRDFYQAYRRGGADGEPMRKDEALTVARRQAIERGEPAQLWAAWVLVGDAR